MSEFKTGDKAWVKCEVLEILQDGTCKIIGNYGSAFWTVADELKALEFEPVESEAVKTVGPKTICVGDRATWSGYKGVVAEWCEQTQRFLFLADNGSKIWVGESELSPVEPDPVIKEYLKTESDPINPSHYKQGGIECIEAIKAATGDGFVGYVWGNVLKYLWRWPKKGGVDDLKKARWYLDRLIKEVGE